MDSEIKNILAISDYLTICKLNNKSNSVTIQKYLTSRIEKSFKQKDDSSLFKTFFNFNIIKLLGLQMFQ
jgi:hypothetical protein